MSGEAVDVGEEPRRGTDAVHFQPLEDEPGLRIVDPVERRQYDLSTPEPVTPERVNPDRFDVPVDAAVRITTEEVLLPQREAVYVRDESGDHVMHTFDSVRSCPPGQYLIQVTTSIKLYFAVDGPVRVSPTPRSTAIQFDGPTDIVIAARSPHRRPSGTIWTTTDLDDVRVAVSSLSCALKTTSPERSFPTLRGHPPRLKLGEELSRPDHLLPPDTGVTIEVNRSLEDVLVAAPLAFYLGAELEWGDRRLRTHRGFDQSLADRHDFETGVERVLKQTFFLDCLTRTEGLYPVDLDERRTFEARAADRLDFAALYDQPIAHRLASYLEVSYDTIADLVPAWSATTYVEPVSESVTYLPYLLDTLSTIRTTGTRRLDSLNDRVIQPRKIEGQITRSTDAANLADDSRPHLILPNSETAVTHAWVGDGIPVGAAKALASGFENRLEREPRSGDIRVQVVCNEPEMRDEAQSVEDIYLGRRDHPFEVDVSTELSTGELEEVLTMDSDFFHFIGHVDRRGFRCGDGWLDANECRSVGAGVFFLNTCRSYEQGEALVRNGSISGIVTVTDLLNHRAAEMGRMMAMYLNCGFPLYCALEAVRDTYSLGETYALLGDAHTVLFQPTTTFPEYVEVKEQSGDVFTLAHRTFPSNRVGIGTDICPSYEAGNRHYLFGGEISTVELNRADLESLLALPMPLRKGGSLRFSVVSDNVNSS